MNHACFFAVPDDIVLTKFSHAEAEYWVKKLLKPFKYSTHIEKLAVGELSEELSPEDEKTASLKRLKTIEETAEEEKRKNDLEVPVELFTLSSDDSVKGGFKNDGQLRQVNDLLAKFCGRHVKPVRDTFFLNCHQHLSQSEPRLKVIEPRLKVIEPRLCRPPKKFFSLNLCCFL